MKKPIRNNINPASISSRLGLSSGSLSIQAPELVRLYRPLNPAQLACVIRSGWKRFSLTEHSNEFRFYIKLSRQYAEMVARQWNAPQYSAGYVVQFDLPYSFISEYETETVAYEEHMEYSVPITDLVLLNRNIIDGIEIVSAFPALHREQKQPALMFE